MGKVTVVARIRAAKGKGDELATFLKEQAGVVRASEPGCLDYTPYRSVADPDAFVFYEEYVDHAALDAHRAAPHLATFRKRRQDLGLVEGAPDIQVFEG